MSACADPAETGWGDDEWWKERNLLCPGFVEEVEQSPGKEPVWSSPCWPALMASAAWELSGSCGHLLAGALWVSTGEAGTAETSRLTTAWGQSPRPSNSF